MPHFTNRIRLGTAVLAAFCALGVAPAVTRAQAQSSDAPATRANSPEDSATADRVSAALGAEPHHFYRHATVTVTNGVVRLGGVVNSNDAIARAVEIARNTPGVSRVEEEMQLEPQGPPTPGH